MKYIKIYEGSQDDYKFAEVVRKVHQGLVFPSNHNGLKKITTTEAIVVARKNSGIETISFSNMFDDTKKILPHLKKSMNKNTIMLIEDILSSKINSNTLSKLSVYEVNIMKSDIIYDRNGKPYDIPDKLTYGYGLWKSDIYACTDGKIMKMSTQDLSIPDYKSDTIIDMADKWDKGTIVERFFAYRRYIIKKMISITEDDRNNFHKLTSKMTNKKFMKYGIGEFGFFDD